MNTVLQAYTLCVIVLFMKMFALSCYQGFYRLRYRQFVNAEDAGFFHKPPGNEELPQVRRAAKAWTNDLENIPLFFVLGGLCVALQTPVLATLWLFGGFTVARIFHTLFYLAQRQPWRTLAYAVGIMALLGMVIMLGGKALSGITARAV